MLHTVDNGKGKIDALFVKNAIPYAIEGKNSGYSAVLGLIGNYTLLQLANTSFLIEFGAIKLFGQTTQTFQYSIIKRSMPMPMGVLGLNFKINFQKVNILMGVGGVLYSETVQASMKRDNLTKDYLDKNCVLIRREIINDYLKGELGNTNSDINQDVMKANLNDAFDNIMTEGKEKENALHTSYAPTLGFNVGLTYQFTPKMSFNVGLRYIMASKVSADVKASDKIGVKMTKYIAASGREVLKPKDTIAREKIDRPDILMITGGVTYTLF